MWGTVGIGYNIDKVNDILKKNKLAVKPDSLSMIFDINIVKNFDGCGIGLLDSPTDIIPAAFTYLNIDINSEKEEDLRKVEELLLSIRPYIRQIHSSKYINDLANGDLCVVLGFSGDVIQSKNRAIEAKNGVKIEYFIPKEGGQVWVDAMALPKDAPNLENAYKFIDYVLQPEVTAENSNFIGYANGNKKALGLIDKKLKSDVNIYPDSSMKKRLFTISVPSPLHERKMVRIWTKFVSGN